tara:strand:- start:2813 stop:3742 length:930 start_codon:yes stop_codon:yes gene_type:complete
LCLNQCASETSVFDNLLTINNISKHYKGVRAVNNISLNVKTGDIYGFLGPNGAGKTTTIRMIMGIIKPDKGNIKILDNNQNILNYNMIGYLPEDRGLYQKQKLGEIIIYFGMLRGLKKNEAKSKALFWLNRFDLINQVDRRVEELSKGNQQKTQFILALIHDPKLIILDEPFTGLDPVNQLLLKEIISEKSSIGTTILFSTHQMEQVERLCNNICLLNNGNIIVEGELDDIKKEYQDNIIEVSFQGSFENEKLKKYLSEINFSKSKIVGKLRTRSSEFIQWFSHQAVIQSYQVKRPSLEQIFIDKVRPK